MNITISDTHPKWIAYEYNGEGEWNDEGPIVTSRAEAWRVVSDVFSAEHTVIENLRTGERYRPIVGEVQFEDIGYEKEKQNE